MRHADIIHAYPTRPGVAQASEIAIPLTPRALFVLGPRGAPQRPLQLAADTGEAAEIATEINTNLLAHAYQWVAANPDHPSFADLVFPEPGPIIQVCDGGTPFARNLDQPPTPRLPQLLGRRGQ